MPTIASAALLDFATRLLTASDVPDNEAALIAHSLVGANLRGHDSHGVMRIPFYLDGLRKGETTAGATLTITKQSDTTIVADGHWGFGQTLMYELTDHLIKMATEHGTGVGTLIHASHVGRLGEYCERAAEAGLVSMMMVNTHGSTRRVAPPGGKAPRLGTNPIAFGVPAKEGPLILDFGTCATAEGKVRVKRIAGETCPDGWLLDHEGNPTNDPHRLYADPPGTIRPLGGDQAYKGFGLALMVEIFSGALSGGICAREVPINQLGNCVFMMVLDPEHLGGAATFSDQITSLVAFIRGCPTVECVDEIQLPGDPERRVLRQREAEGIPFDDGNWQQLVDLAANLGVEPPQQD